MNKYKVTVLVSHWQTIEVEAENEDVAEATALDQFDLNQATFSESEVTDTRLIEENSDSQLEDSTED